VLFRVQQVCEDTIQYIHNAHRQVTGLLVILQYSQSIVTIVIIFITTQVNLIIIIK